NYFLYFHQCSEGLLAVYDHYTNSYGFIDTEGKVVIEPQYYEVLDFTEGMAAVWKDADIHVDTFSGCGTAVSHSKWGFINRSDQYVIQPTYREVYEFMGGYAIADGQLIDRTGTPVAESTDMDKVLLNKFYRSKETWYYNPIIRFLGHNIENFEGCLI